MHDDRSTKLAFLLGAVTTFALAGTVAALLGGTTGLGDLLRGTPLAAVPNDAGADEDPDEVDEHDLPQLEPWTLRELVDLRAVIENAENPTGVVEHDTLLVRPDARRGYVLRPGVRVNGYMLATGQALNLDPPVLYLPPEAPMSPALRDYVGDNTRLRYTYSVDDLGFRRTVPEVESTRKVLMVGDSVLFGVGVDDSATLASALQARVGSAVQIVNAGVGGYGPDQIYAAAEELSARYRYEALVYIACQNDFDDRSAEAYLASAGRVLERLGGLAPRFERRGAVLLATAMEHTLYDVLGERGWTPQEEALTAQLRNGLPALAARHGFAYVDWAEIAERTSQLHGTLFHRFALYVDHVHLSPLGNRLAARELHRALSPWGLDSGR